jgi:mannitol/fructose-specific phosphotransferase system IIA component (Ntr-type)
MKLCDFVVREAIIPELGSSERNDVIADMAQALVKAGTATKSIADELVKMVLEREKRGSTGFGKGVAVPHVKHPKIKKMAAAIGIHPQGIDFNALDKQPVYTVILLLSPEGNPEEHLQAMENIFSNLQNDQFRRFLRQSTTVEAVWDLLEEADTQQLQG